uniref:Zgc:162297 n=1 Tax=Oncorhynchus kisutch TaxID=8019 RepID=A0A8C7F8V0_ONCKI
MKFLKLFGRAKSVVIGMIHVQALPGKYYWDAYVVFYSLFVFNFDVMFFRHTFRKHGHSSNYRGGMPRGRNLSQCGNCMDFIRAEGYVFSHVADEGLLNGCAGDLLRYRKQMQAEHVQIFTDIKKKHSSHALTSDVSIVETARAAEFFLSDGLIITGTATGVQADPMELRDVAGSVRLPVLIGSGVTYDNVEYYLDASAMIIGSHFKRGGVWANAVDPESVKKFMGKVHLLRN